MQYKLLHDQPKTYVLIFKTDEEISAGLKKFAVEQKLSGSSFKAIGALSSVKLAWFSWMTKKYEAAVALDEQLELLSLIGDISIGDITLKDGEPQVHAHVVVSKSDGTAHGGHLQEATVRPTCELILTESPLNLRRQVDPESGIALIRL
jgi:predicted DNA-binding protein with PD1-like motif